MNVLDAETSKQFSRLYEALYPSVYAYAARRVGAGAADEVAAETFLVAWRRFETIPSEPLPWLYAVARNAIAGAPRRRAPFPHQPAGGVITRESPPSVSRLAGANPSPVDGERGRSPEAQAILSQILAGERVVPVRAPRARRQPSRRWCW